MILTVLSKISWVVPIFLFIASNDVNGNEQLTAEQITANCEALLMNYAYASTSVTYCFIKHARPITVCRNCVEPYFNATEWYNKINQQSGKDHCGLVLINVDRLEIVQRNFHYITGQWDEASCEDCYHNGQTQLNVDVETILNMDKKLDECISQNNSTICDTCNNLYTKMNDFYDTKKSNNRFCMDIVDLMNTTRSDWSETHGCKLVQTRPELLFWFTIVCVSISPLVFYFCTWITALNNQPIP